MGRLIDADDVISLLANHHFDDSKENTDLLIHNLCKEVKSVPTAYDVDAVVDKLKQRSKEYNSGVRLHGKPEEMITTEAIEIVKSGGGGVDAIRSVGLHGFFFQEQLFGISEYRYSCPEGFRRSISLRS